MNVFDGAVVLVGTVELIWSGNNVLSVLRTFRLLRVLKLLNTSPSLRTLMKAVLLSIEDILYFLAVLTLLIITFAILGVQFFRGNLEADGMTPRINFETLENSIVTVFQVVTAENWNEVMYKCYRTVGWPSTFFFVPLLYLGHYMFLSLFLAIMLGNFDQLDIIQVHPADILCPMLRYASLLLCLRLPAARSLLALCSLSACSLHVLRSLSARP
jgi:hypothetical protein